MLINLNFIVHSLHDKTKEENVKKFVTLWSSGHLAMAVSARLMTRSGQGNCSSRMITFRKYWTIKSSGSVPWRSRISSARKPSWINSYKCCIKTSNLLCFLCVTKDPAKPIMVLLYGEDLYRCRGRFITILGEDNTTLLKKSAKNEEEKNILKVWQTHHPPPLRPLGA